MKRLLITLVAILSTFTTMADSRGVIMQYHHVSEQTPASTSVTPEVFKQHMQHLQQHHKVLPLPELVEKIRRGETLPDKAIAITFDDGYEDIYINAHPILQEFGFPYTIFINPDFIGKRQHQLDWQQVKTMASENVHFANHSSQHKHLLQVEPGDSQAQWLQKTLQDIDNAEKIITSKLGYSLKYLAYPFGEYNLTLQQALAEKGYVAFGQQSGAVGQYSDFTALPRFPIASRYARLETLKVKLSSLPLPVLSTNVTESALAYGQQPDPIELNIDIKDIHPHLVSCYFKGEPLSLDWQQNTVSFTLPEPLKPGRSRVNCTAPSKAESGRYYWYSTAWVMPTKEGIWLD